MVDNKTGIQYLFIFYSMFIRLTKYNFVVVKDCIFLFTNWELTTEDLLVVKLICYIHSVASISTWKLAQI